MGTVAIVYDRWLGREVALKTPASTEDRDRLLREALITARLDHPGIVAIYDAGTRADAVVRLTDADGRSALLRVARQTITLAP